MPWTTLYSSEYAAIYAADSRPNPHTDIRTAEPRLADWLTDWLTVEYFHRRAETHICGSALNAVVNLPTKIVIADITAVNSGGCVALEENTRVAPGHLSWLSDITGNESAPIQMAQCRIPGWPFPQRRNSHPGSPGAPGGPPRAGGPRQGQGKIFFVYFSFRYQKDKNI